MEPLVITVAPLAPPAVQSQHPDLPRTPRQIANEVIEAYRAGAAIAHLHVADAEGRPARDLAAFRETISLIRGACDIVIEGSTGGVNELSAQDRSLALQTDVELASLNPGSVNYDAGVYVNSPQDIDYWVRTMHERRIKPSIAVFETGMIATAVSYAQRGLIAPPMFFNFVLGQAGAIPAQARNLAFLIESLPAGSVWQTTGHSGHDLEAVLWTIAFGGHARAGFEDNIFYQPKRRAASNAELIQRIVRIAREADRPVATPADARRILGLK